jgi:hypothetical protein
MRTSLALFLLAALTGVALLSTGGCSCGFDCSGNNNGGGNRAALTLGFSDSLPEELEQVVIEVDRITFQRSGADDSVVDRFTIDGQSGDTFSIDLLQYRGIDQLVVMQNEILEPGTYTAVFIDVIDDSTSNSWVKEMESGTVRPLTVEDNRLVLEGLTLTAGSQAYTVEFSLAQSLQRIEGSDGNSYLLTENGVRVVDNETDASLSGEVDTSLFNAVSPCSEKLDLFTGNRVYLYKDSREADELVDVYTDSASDTPDAGAAAPFAVASVTLNEDGKWEYAFGYLPTGNYTLAFACDTAGDDPVEWDQLDIPQPDEQIYQFGLPEAGDYQCDITASTRSCPR